MVSIIIPTFLNDDAVHRLVRLIREHTPSQYEIIVVDNGSEARGCVKATNQGLRAAQGDILAVLNDDCQPQPGWLEPLVAKIEEGVSLCSPQWKYARIAGHCMVFSREAYKFTTGFDERYRHWNADHHFELILAQSRYLICQVSGSVVLHITDDPLRIHHRKSAFLGNHDQLPNTGEWYNIDNAKFHEYWKGRVPSHVWPEDWTSTDVPNWLREGQSWPL